MVGRCLSTSKCSQMHGRPNYPAYSKNDVCPKTKSKTSQNKGLWVANNLKWFMLVLLLILLPLVALGALMKEVLHLCWHKKCWFHYLLFRCPKLPSKAFALNQFPGNFCGLQRQYPVKFPAQFNIDNEEKNRWFENRNGLFLRPANLSAGHFTTLYFCVYSQNLLGLEP